MELQLSEKSQSFIENLTVFLLTSGKNEAEVKEVVEEIRGHLYEAEQDNKSVDDIIGESQREYMQEISNEMPVDYKGMLKWLPVILIDMFAITLIQKASLGGIALSMMEIIGNHAVCIILTLSIGIAFRYISSNEVSKMKERAILFGIGIMPLPLFAGLLLLNRVYVTPTITLGTTGNIIAVSLCVLTFIVIAIGTKTKDFVILPAIILLPAPIMNAVTVSEEIRVMVSMFVPIVGVILYATFELKRENSTEKK